MRATLLLAATSLALVAACDRSHMSSQYGQTYRRAFTTQVLPVRPSALGNQGLDPEEAAIVLETYRKSLSPTKEAQAARSAPVIVLPSTPGAQPAGHTP